MLYALIPFLPLFSFLVVGIGEQWIKDRAHLVAVPAMAGSFLLSLLALHDVATGAPINVTLYTWLTSGNLDIHIGISIDRLTAVMLILVTTVSTLVHIYTIGYMHGEPGYARFFAYIALFTFSMLMLVMADNLLQLFVFWEAVGLCSYLLIGHWYERPSACAAATKAFLVNRVGDFGFILGLFLVWVTFGSLDYVTIFAHAQELASNTTNLLGPFGGTWNVSVMTMICLLLFTGAVGKSAQVPLHVWLPDAMEGPTPVSALLHAGVVNVGGFVMIRLSPLMAHASVAQDILLYVGLGTALVGSLVMMTRMSIKLVLAWSTIAQMGFVLVHVGQPAVRVRHVAVDHREEGALQGGGHRTALAGADGDLVDREGPRDGFENGAATQDEVGARGADARVRGARGGRHAHQRLRRAADVADGSLRDLRLAPRQLTPGLAADVRPSTGRRYGSFHGKLAR